MKKAILVLILLIIAAGVCFYFGWINVHPGTYYLAHSTVTGTVGYPLQSGRLHWLWQKLIPWSFHLYELKTERYAAEYEFSLPLPGSEALSEYGRFSLDGTVNLEYFVDFDSALSLLENGIIDNFTDSIEQGLAARTQDVLTAFLLDMLSDTRRVTDEFAYGSVQRLRGLLENELAQYASGYDLHNVLVHVTFVSIPRIEAYEAAMAGYIEFTDALNKEKAEDARREWEKRLRLEEVDAEIEKLRKYGALIAEYPDILKYLYIQKLADKVRVLVLPQDESGGFPKLLEPDASRLEKEFLPAVPEKELTPPSPEEEEVLSSPDASSEEGSFEAESDIPPDTEETEETGQPWYRYLMFWKYFTK